MDPHDHFALECIVSKTNLKNIKNNKSYNYLNTIQTDLSGDESIKIKKIRSERIKGRLEFGSEEFLINHKVLLRRLVTQPSRPGGSNRN